MHVRHSTYHFSNVALLVLLKLLIGVSSPILYACNKFISIDDYTLMYTHIHTTLMHTHTYTLVSRVILHHSTFICYLFVNVYIVVPVSNTLHVHGKYVYSTLALGKEREIVKEETALRKEN